MMNVAQLFRRHRGCERSMENTMRVSATATAKRITAFLLAWALVVATCPLEGNAYQTPPPAAQAPAGQSAEQLEQLVAPIALYPDALVAQILAGSTFPTQIAVASYWLGENKSLTGNALMQAVDKQTWDPSVKALT